MSLSHIPSEKRRILEYLYRLCSGHCFYCNKVCNRPDTYDHYTPDKATIDHVKPRGRGGCDSMRNLVLSCARCNNLKGSLDADEFNAAKAYGCDFERYVKYVYPVKKPKTGEVASPYSIRLSVIRNEVYGLLNGDRMLGSKKNFKNKEKLRARLQGILNTLPGDINQLKPKDRDFLFERLDTIENLKRRQTIARVIPPIEEGQSI